MYRADVDNATRLLCVAQSPYKFLCKKERSAQIYRHHLVVVRFRRVPEIGFMLHARVIHQDVCRTEPCPRGVDKLAHFVKIRHVGFNRHRLAARLLDGAARLFSASRIADIVNDDLRTLRPEAFCNALADSCARAGDDGDLSSKTLHHLYSFCCLRLPRY